MFLPFFLLMEKVNVTKVQTINNFGQEYHFTAPAKDRANPYQRPHNQRPHRD
jgi:hypothetical protein